MPLWNKYIILLLTSSLATCTHKHPIKQMSSIPSTQKFYGVLLASELQQEKKAFLPKFITKNQIGEDILPLYLKKPQAQRQLEEKLKNM